MVVGLEPAVGTQILAICSTKFISSYLLRSGVKPAIAYNFDVKNSEHAIR
jgi:hypothetical protein